MGNDLIAAPKDETHWYTGLGIAESIADIVSGVESENWVEAGIGIFGTAAEAAAWATDPLGQLIQYGVSWLMEHLQPLRDALDWLAGDPPQIEAYAETWQRVSAFVNTTATSLLDRSRTDTTTWQGATADAYRSYAAALAQAVADTAKTAGLIGTIVSIAGMLVAAVRELVRDLIAELVAILVERAWIWAAETATGFGAPAAQAQIAALVAKWTGKVARVIAKLCRSLNNLKGLTGKLDEIWGLLTNAWRRFREGKDAKPGLPAKDPISGPGTKPPHVADGTSTSSSNTTTSGSSKPSTADAARPPKDAEESTVPSGGGGSGNKPPRNNNGLTSPNDPEDFEDDPNVIPKLPERVQGANTEGSWYDPESKKWVDLRSEKNNTYYKPLLSWIKKNQERLGFIAQGQLGTHLELQFVLRMMERGIKDAVIYINNEVCGTRGFDDPRNANCHGWLKELLPAEWKLTVRTVANGVVVNEQKYEGK